MPSPNVTIPHIPTKFFRDAGVDEKVVSFKCTEHIPDKDGRIRDENADPDKKAYVILDLSKPHSVLASKDKSARSIRIVRENTMGYYSIVMDRNEKLTLNYFTADGEGHHYDISPTEFKKIYDKTRRGYVPGIPEDNKDLQDDVGHNVDIV